MVLALASYGQLNTHVKRHLQICAGQHVVGDPHLRGFPGTHVVKGALHCVGSYSSLKGIVVKVEAYLLEITWLNTLHGELLSMLCDADGHSMSLPIAGK